MDDFALRKRQSYGSILIDAQSRKVVDLIPSRKLSDVQEWLQNFPNLTFIIRDGSHTFRSAISEVSPDIIQIADRFHVLKSLTDHAVKALRALIPKKIKLGEENKKSTSKQFINNSLLLKTKSRFSVRSYGKSEPKVGNMLKLLDFSS